MTNEWTLVVKTSEPVNFICADGVGIEKGSLLSLADPMTAALCAATAGPVAGVCAREKIANDGRTEVAVYRRGIFKVGYASGAIAVGQPIVAAAAVIPNAVKYLADGTTTASGAQIIGHALETAATTETFLAELML
jgi:hypothetical protein